MNVLRAFGLLFVVTLGLMPVSAGCAQTPEMAGKPSLHPVLVELFTSEGCSSCPPADSLLRQINGKSTPDGQQIVALSEHVTYWNRLGWTDPFSAETFTARQSGYGQHFQLDDVYTPQMVVGGRAQILGSDGHALLDALHDQRSEPQVPLQILSVQHDPASLGVRVRIGSLAKPVPLDLLAAYTDDADTSHVARGENAGRALQHVAVARSLVRLATVAGPGEQLVQVPLPCGDAAAAGRGHTLVLFLQTPGLGPVLGVALQPLP